MSSKTDIKTREDVYTLVSTFYEKVRANGHIGPIFNTIVNNWPEHLALLTSFWETNLFFKIGYKGDPHGVHQQVDEAANHGITQEHFVTWLRLWFETIDELFEGPRAETAKNRARKMSTFMFIGIFKARLQKSSNTPNPNN